MRLAANLDFLFTDRPVPQRLQAARAAGFDGVEMLFPHGENGELLAEHLGDSGLDCALINSPAGDWAEGERGFAGHAGGRFADSIGAMLEMAAKLRPARIHVLAGVGGTEDRFVENLSALCAAHPDQAFTIEPLNPTDMPGYLLGSFEQAARVIGAVAHPNLGLQYDTYHARLIEGDALACLDRHAELVTHVQVSSATGRSEPIDQGAIFARLRELDYSGYVSGEYRPQGRTEDGLEWLRLARDR